MLLQMFPFGMAQEISPLFIHYLHRDFAFNIASIGLIFTFGSIASSIASPVVGKLFDKLPTPRLMFAGICITSLGLYINAFSTHLWQFYLANAIMQVGVILFSALGIPYLIGKWFDKDEKPLALGIAFAGGSIGNFFWQPIISNLLAAWPLHRVYFVCASIALFTGIGIVLLLRIKKSEKVKSMMQHESLPLCGIGFDRTKHLPAFWILASSMIFLGLNVAAQSSQYANFFEYCKFTPKTIGLIGSAFAIAALLGNIFGGALISKCGLLNGGRVAFFLQFFSAASMLTLNFMPKSGFGFLWAILYGLSGYIYMSAPAVMVQTLFGMRQSSQILAWVNIFFAVGFASGNVLFGLFVDKLGFKMAWIFILIFIVICYTLMLTMIRKIGAHHYADRKPK